MGGAENSLRVGGAIIRAHFSARDTRALSVAIPVFAYICLYSFDTSTKAMRALSVFTHFERCQIFGRL